MNQLTYQRKLMGQYIRDILITVLIAVVIFLGLQFTIGAFEVYGTSMVPNILPSDYIMADKVTYHFRNPQRGEVIILNSPQQSQKDLIKRVIGLPGDTIEIKNNTLYINGIAINEPYIKEPIKYTYGKQVVPADSYFVLGDNRNVSADSHSGWFLNKDNIIGRAMLIYWPFSRIRIIQQYHLNV
jgi:signal peptidase I